MCTWRMNNEHPVNTEERTLAGQTDHPWPGPDDKQIVAEMISNPESEHWSACYAYLQGFVSKNCADLQFMKDDLIQETMLSIRHGLPSFRFESKLKTWLTTVVLHRANDQRRKKHKLALIEISIKSSDDEEREGFEAFQHHDSQTPEDKYLINEYLEEVDAEIEKFIERYTKSVRNKEIIHMYLIEGYSIKEIASKLGMKPPAVNLIIRSAQLHLRTWYKEHPF
jgi:RNA polymerase sigma factor (sigma-70 family)